LVDGCTVTLPDTPANQKQYPQPKTQKPGLGFPMIRLVVLLTLATATLQGLAVGPYQGKESGENCPLCGKPLVSRYGKRGAFWGCSGYPDCNFTKPGEGEQGRAAPVPTDQACPECGKPMLQRMGRRGPFLGCSGYPD